VDIDHLPGRKLDKSNNDYLMTRREAAEFLRISPHTLAQWKSNGRYHIPTYEYARRVFYRLGDLKKFQNKHFQVKAVK